MTDELNELASSYADGETTPEETALVETDEQAQMVVENIRLLSNRLRSVEPQSEALRELQISAALAAFDTSASDDTIVIRKDVDAIPKPDLRPDDTVAFTSASQPDTKGQSGADGSGFTDPSIQGLVGNVVPISSKPRYRWVPPLAGAAALVLVLGAGFTVLTSQNGSFDSSNEATSSAVADASPQVAQQADASEGDAPTYGGPAAEGTAEFSDSESDVADGASVDESAQTESTTSNETELLTFDVLPDQAELETIGSQAVLSTDYGPSSCATDAAAAKGGALIGFIAINVDGASGELLVFTSETSPRGVSVSAVNSQCELLP